MYIPSECQINAISCQSNIQVPSITKDCMLNKYENCPGFENVVDFLRNEICKKQSADDTISFKQWEKVDCSELMDDELPVDEFLEIIVEKLKKPLSNNNRTS